MNMPKAFRRYTTSFLSNRHTQVEINGERSKRFILREGLPQGSALSPLLFLIFINGIDVELDADTIASLFADDTAEWIVDGKVRGINCKLMQQEIDKILDWAEKWKMVLNTDKTKLMVTSTSNDDKKWDREMKAGEDQIEAV